MRLSANEMSSLIDALQLFEGHEIIVSESISRERTGRGYDRHSSTYSRFSFLADKFFGVSISGELLGIESKNGVNLYCLSLRSVVEFHWDAEKLVITEHYEENTARQTVIECLS